MPIFPDSYLGKRIAGITATVAYSSLLHAAPVVPGLDRLANSDAADDVLAGEMLLGELNCVQCHQQSDGSQSRIWSKDSPDLSAVGARVTPQYLRKFITNPHSTKPGTTMPSIFHSSDAIARDGAVDYLTHFLTSLGGPIEPSRSGGGEKTVAQGKELFHSVGCVACHGPQESEQSENFKPLGDLATKTTVDALTEFLLDPHKVRPSGRMPSLWLSVDEARAISVYLLRAQLENPQSKKALPAALPGLNVEYYEVAAGDKIPDFSKMTPKNKAAVDNLSIKMPFKRRSNNYTLRYTGYIRIDETAEYTFGTQSDDGSWLLINDQLVVDNGGIHGMRFRGGNLALEKGTHKFELAYSNAGAGGDLRVFWRKKESRGRGRGIPATLFTRSGGNPMVPLNTMSFKVHNQKAMIGKRMFQAMRCASCHQLEGAPPLSASKNLVDLDLASADGCLSDNIKKGLPDYQLSSGQKRQIMAALKNRAALAQPESAARQVTKTLATFNCYACHERDGIGGPSDSIGAEFFNTVGDIDLGEEGKIPPTLSKVGAKLKTSALHSILSSQKLHVRHYMKTRMPNFGKENLSAFLESVGAADGHPQPDENPDFSEPDAAIGRRLVGTTGLACITCHRIAGQDALAIQGIDLATVFDRVNPSWFETFLLQPAAFNKDTRMPQFWPDGESPFQDILGGDAKRQIGALWSYLSLKNSLPLPEGITLAGDVAMELTPLDQPIVHRTFMEDVGPRAILTGFPEKLSTAFDANVMRLAKVWRGRFFDHSGVESGRTDKFLSPLGQDVLDLPAGPAFASLSSPQSAWPSVDKSSRDTGGKFLGYQLGEDRRPTFRYKLAGMTIEEKPEPQLRPGGAVLKRSFNLSNDSDQNLYFLAAEGDSISEQGGQSFQVGDAIIHLEGSAPIKPIIRTVDGRKQIIVPIAAGKTTLTQIIEW